MRLPELALVCFLAVPLAARADDIITVTISGTESASYTYVDQSNPADPNPHTINGPSTNVNGTVMLDLTTSTLSDYTSVPTTISFDNGNSDTITLPTSFSSDCSYDPSAYSVSIACFSGVGSLNNMILSYDAIPAALSVGGIDTLGRITYELDGTLAPEAAAAITPEPSSFALLGTGCLGLGGLVRRRFAKSQQSGT